MTKAVGCSFASRFQDVAHTPDGMQQRPFKGCVHLAAQAPVMSLVAGRVIMHKGFVCGKGSQAVTTEAGVSFIKDKGLQPLVVDIAESGFYRPL